MRECGENVCTTTPSPQPSQRPRPRPRSSTIRRHSRPHTPRQRDIRPVTTRASTRLSGRGGNTSRWQPCRGQRVVGRAHDQPRRRGARRQIAAPQRTRRGVEASTGHTHTRAGVDSLWLRRGRRSSRCRQRCHVAGIHGHRGLRGLQELLKRLGRHFASSAAQFDGERCAAHATAADAAMTRRSVRHSEWGMTTRRRRQETGRPRTPPRSDSSGDRWRSCATAATQRGETVHPHERA
jgi:hypothetical protein